MINEKKKTSELGVFGVDWGAVVSTSSNIF